MDAKSLILMDSMWSTPGVSKTRHLNLPQASVSSWPQSTTLAPFNMTSVTHVPHHTTTTHSTLFTTPPSQAAITHLRLSPCTLPFLFSIIHLPHHAVTTRPISSRHYYSTTTVHQHQHHNIHPCPLYYTFFWPPSLPHLPHRQCHTTGAQHRRLYIAGTFSAPQSRNIPVAPHSSPYSRKTCT